MICKRDTELDETPACVCLPLVVVGVISISNKETPPFQCTVAIMVVRWAICSAGKISHDFTVAIKSLSADHHQVLYYTHHTAAYVGNWCRTHN